MILGEKGNDSNSGYGWDVNITQRYLTALGGEVWARRGRGREVTWREGRWIRRKVRLNG